MRAYRARRRIFRHAPPLSQRRLLHRPHLSIDGLPGHHVPGSLRDSPHVRLDRAMAGNAARSGTKDLPPTAGLSRPRSAELHPYGSPQLVAAVIFRTSVRAPLAAPFSLASRITDLECLRLALLL